MFRFVAKQYIIGTPSTNFFILNFNNISVWYDRVEIYNNKKYKYYFKSKLLYLSNSYTNQILNNIQIYSINKNLFLTNQLTY